jgi:hypothetical protein
MVITFLQSSTAEVTTTDLTAQVTLDIHPSADYAIFFVGVSAPHDATERGITGILHKYNTDAPTVSGVQIVSIMKESNQLMEQNNRKFRLQMGRRTYPATGTHTYEVTFNYTGAKTVLVVALSYSGVDPTGPGLQPVEGETNQDSPAGLTLGYVTTVGGKAVDGILYRETMPGGVPVASGGQAMATASGIFTVEEQDWGIVYSEKDIVVTGTQEMGWSGFTNQHIHAAGVVVVS